MTGELGVDYSRRLENGESVMLTTVLLVEDETLCREAARAVLEYLGLLADSAASAEEALAAFDPGKHAVVVTDHCMPGMSGGELATELKRRSPSTPVIMHSACPPQESPGIDAILNKPARLEDFRHALSRFVQIQSRPRLTSGPPASRDGETSRVASSLE